ncbi:MAG: hypothetical protein AAF558_11960 [Verrucomicrobiota bacterium]
MKRTAFYNRLGLYLLSIDANIHPGSCACAAGAIYSNSETPLSVQSKIGEMLKLWYGEYLFDRTEELFQTETKCDIGPIISALEDVCDELHIVGHDVIQGSFALKSIHSLDAYVPQDVVDRIATNILKNGKAHPGMFYGYTADQIREEESIFDDYDVDSTPIDIANSLVNTLRRIKKSYFGFEFLAQETHLITHGEALTSIYGLGHHVVFKRLLKGWYLRLKLLEPIYELDLSVTHRSPNRMDWDPRKSSFWENYRKHQLFIHPIKTMYSYLNLKSRNLFSPTAIQFMEEEKLPFMVDSRFPDDW